MPDYANWILNQIDEHNQLIKHRLYRQHCTISTSNDDQNNFAVKDLRLMGRDLKRTIIIDNLSENYMSSTPDNGICIPSWYDDLDDTCLTKLKPLLESIVLREIPDVRQIVGG